MRFNWKYFIMRTINALVVLFIVIMIVSVFLGITYEREKKVASRKYINVEMEENYHKLSNMTVQEREDWTDKKQEEFRVGDYDDFWWIRSKDVYSKSVLRESFDQASKVIQLKFGETYLIQVREGEDDSKVKNDVVSIILHFLPRTILLFSTALLICLPLSIYLGVKTAVSENKLLGKVISFFNMIGSSVPIWFGGMVGLIIFAFYLRWIDFSPLPFPYSEGLPYYWGVFKRMLFPILVIIVIKLNPIAWSTRSLVSSELEEDYIVGARAKGLPEEQIARKHALRSSAPPIISKSAQMILSLVPEIIIFESIIGWPGVGYLFYRALDLSGGSSIKIDANVLVGLVFFISIVIIVINWIADILYGLADPRVKISEKD